MTRRETPQIRQRLNDLGRALSRPLPPGEREVLRREYLLLTDPEITENVSISA